MKYNPETHYIQVMINGEWVDYKYFNPNETVALIPVMTSNTLPEGVVSASSYWSSSSSNDYPYYAFNQNESNKWYTSNTGYHTNAYLQYEFKNEVTITKFETKEAGITVGGNALSSYGTIQLLTSLDGNTWNQAYSMTMESHTDVTYLPSTIELEKPITCKYIKLKIDGYGWLATCNTLQAYGYK